MYLRNSLFVAFFAASTALTCHQIRADSYSVTVPTGGKFFAAYHFASATIHNIFPPNSLPWGTQLQIWNNSSQQYDIQTLDDLAGDWDPTPGYTLSPGQAFFIVNYTGNSLPVTISGTQITGSHVLTLYHSSTVYNGYGAVRIPADYLECVCDYGTGMDYPGEDEDAVAWWNPNTQEWNYMYRGTDPENNVTWGGTCDGGHLGTPLPTEPGWGVFFYPVSTKYWDYTGPVSCTD